MNYYSETTVRATIKAHECDACGQSIAIGSSMVRWSGKSGAEFVVLKYHVDCFAAEAELNRRNDSPQGVWWLFCHLRPADTAWMRELYPAVAERLFGAAAPDHTACCNGAHSLCGEGP